jgi:TolB-like protein
MHTYAARGQFELALRQYHCCRDTLRRELDVAPSADMENLYREIREGKSLRQPATASAEAAASSGTLPASSDMPSIAVLPFENMSGDPEQEYFSDGITENIITDLSKVSTLKVISRNTVFAFKGKPADACRVARQLDVRHVLAGNVRKAAGRVRITAQLIDATDNSPVWAEHYDRNLDNIFELQDEIAHALVAALRIKLLPEERKAIETRPTKTPRATSGTCLRATTLSGAIGEVWRLPSASVAEPWKLTPTTLAPGR